MRSGGPCFSFLSLQALAADQDLIDLDLYECLAVALHLLVLLLALVMEYKDLVAAAFANDLGRDLRALEILLEVAFRAGDGDDIGELKLAALGTGLFDLDQIAR